MIHTTLNRIQLLSPSAKVETLLIVSRFRALFGRTVIDPLQTQAESAHLLTSVSIAKGGVQLSGVTILTMPYFSASSRMLWIYATGSLNCSAVGRYVGDSRRPKRRFCFGGWLFGAPWSLRSTVARSSGAALRALKGIVPTPFSCAPLITGIAIPPILDFGAPEPPSKDTLSVATRKVVIVAPVGGPLGGIKSTMALSLLQPARPLS
jgi:hypothetical protein